MKGRTIAGGIAGLALALAAAAPSAAPSPAAPPLPPEPGEGVRPAVMDLAYVKTVRAAMDTLPNPPKGFYKSHRAEMPSQGPEPHFPVRGPERRFLVDRLLAFPFTALPHAEPALAVRYGEKAAGIGRLPWLVQESYRRLVAAMKAGDEATILAESDTLAMLVVDLHTVVNLTENFDGQMTGQHGLYVRLTDKLPQVLGSKLKLSPDAARYLDAPEDYVFSAMVGTYVWLDNTLYLEALARRGKSDYGQIYFADLARRVGPIVRERLSRAAETAGSFWYTAWTVAGRPELR